MNMKVELVLKVPIRPSSPTPPHLRDFQLSFIDERIPPFYIPLIIYYYNLNKGITQSQMSHRLKTSLSHALVHYYPLAGRMKGQQALVDCNDEGVMFLEAIADGTISEVVKTSDSLVLDNLIPFTSNGPVTTAEELLAVQVTLFECGGIAVGVCMSHRTADGCTLSSFIQCWMALAASGDSSTKVAIPVYNSATLFPPRNSPDFKPNCTSLSVQPHSQKLAMKRFVFSSSAINELKVEVQKGSSIVEPTRVEVVSAFLWSQCLLAKKVGKAELSVAYHPVNLRGRLPALTQNSFGNLFQMTSAENTGVANWIQLVEKLRVAFGKIDSEYTERLLRENGFRLAMENFTEISKFLGDGNVHVIRFSNYCRFPFYEADFGWGKPVWVSSASFGNKDTILLLDSSVESGGGIEAWIVMADQDMIRLEHDTQIHHFTTSSLQLIN